MDEYCAYIRKSRADLEAEARGEGETLARHKAILDNLAKGMRISIQKYYMEIVSGETIAARPEMQSLLSDVESGMWKGVLVVEVERLARGDTIDQGIVSQTFKYSDTEIITPVKIYHPDDESDEEFFEFSLFMSRREYKTTKRRMQAGRISSVNEGKFCGNVAPYGYQRKKLKGEKGFILEVLPEEADAVRIVFDLYVNQKMGTTSIAQQLDAMGYKPRKAKKFTTPTIVSMLDNPTYKGCVPWGRRKIQNVMKDGVITHTRPRSNTYRAPKGLHESIVSEDLWNRAHDMRERKIISTPRKNTDLTNPLCGLIICAKCGSRMQRRPAGARQPADVIMCQNVSCDNKSSYMSLIEARIIDTLNSWIGDYEIDIKEPERIDTIASMESNLSVYQKEIDTLNAQLAKTYDLLEQGIYTTEVFFSRTSSINQKIEDTTAAYKNVQNQIEKEQKFLNARMNFLPRIRNIVDCYWSLDSAKAKNDLLKEVIDHIDYQKDVKGRGHEDEFVLKLYPIVQ